MADMKVKYDNITILTWSLIGRFVMLAIMYFKTFKSKNRLLFSNFQLFGFLNICYQVSELIYIIVIQVLVKLLKSKRFLLLNVLKYIIASITNRPIKLHVKIVILSY
jgi:hypothetical protein